MKIRSKVALSTGIGLVALLVAFYISGRFIISDSIANIEKKLVAAMPDVRMAYTDEIKVLQNIATTAAVHPATISAAALPWSGVDIPPRTDEDGYVLSDKQLNLFAVIGMDGHLRNAIINDHYTPSLSSPPRSILKYFDPDGPLMSYLATNRTAKSGLLALPYEQHAETFYSLCVFAPVFKTNDTTHPIGVLVFGRDILLKSLSGRNTSGIVASASISNISGVRDYNGNSLHTLFPKEPTLTLLTNSGEKSSDPILTLPLQDIYGNSTVEVEVKLDSSLSTVESSSIAHFMILLVAVGLIFFIPIFLVQTSLTMSYISRLGKIVNRIKLDSEPINWQEHDEFKPIADKFDRLIANVTAIQAEKKECEIINKALHVAVAGTLVTFDNSGKILSRHLCVGKTHIESIVKHLQPGNNFREIRKLSESAFQNEIALIDQAYEHGGGHFAEFATDGDAGAVIWLQARYVRIDKNRILVNARDITMQHNAGIERSRLEDKISQMQKTETFDFLAGGLAHDYNNMLTAMLGNVDLILCNSIEEPIREIVGDIRVAMLQASAIVRRMLSYACKSDPVIEPIDIPALTKDLVRLMRRSIPDNVKLIVNSIPEVPVIKMDSTQLWQIVMNLVMNACDALEERNGTVRVTTSGMEMTTGELLTFKINRPIREGWYAVITVEDTGCGMDEHTIARIFDPFFTTKPKGRGLGLASVIGIIKSFNGGVSVRSSIGKGTKFTVIFPAIIKEQGEPMYSSELASMQSQSQLPSRPGIMPLQKPSNETNHATPVTVNNTQLPTSPDQVKQDAKKSILIVDDDISILKLLQIILKTGGYNVITAESGADGLKKYMNSGIKIDICLMDVSMGDGMSGLELCAEIRKLNQNIPLVLMSAYRAKEISAKMAAAGVSGFLAKPFRGNDVLELIAKHLRESDKPDNGGDVGTVV